MDLAAACPCVSGCMAHPPASAPLGRREHTAVKEDGSLTSKQHAFVALLCALLVAGALALAGCGSASSHTSKPSGGASASPMAMASTNSSPLYAVAS